MVGLNEKNDIEALANPASKVKCNFRPQLSTFIDRIFPVIVMKVES